MVVKKSYFIITALILSLISAPTVYGDNNNLVQLDLKKSSGDSVDVTLVTSENYGDNVLVRKKSDNKYVILIPKIQSSGYSASNLNGVRDLVSNVDVKTVNDTTGGYTKVTLITTKPLDIKTKTVKSTPITAEQKEYNTLIAQANAVKNTVTNQEIPKLREQKTEITVDKAPKSAQKQEVKEQTKNSNQAKPENKKTEIKLTEIAPEAIEKETRKPHLQDFIKDSKMDKALEEIQTASLSEPTPVVNEEIQDIENMIEQPAKISLLSKIKSSRIPSKLPKTIGTVLLAIFAISLISKLSKKKNITSNMPEPPSDILTETPDYSSIADNKELSWKEKYQLYLDKSATPISRGDNKGSYSFIKQPSKEAIEAKRAELEKMFSEDETSEKLYNEDSAISRTIKFKAFENNKNLSMSKRGNMPKSRFKKYEHEIPLHEQRNIELEDSPLSANPRNLEGANLKVSDVDKKRIKYEPKEYIMSSVDEYLQILDKEKTAQVEPVSTENSILSGSIVKSGFKISPDKGIYLVNKDGKNSLVGKVNDQVFVLKNFDKNITKPIQVRHDNDNVYMVKAEGFKSLVEVDEDKMGVLIEL